MTLPVLQTFRDTTQPRNMVIDSLFQGVFAYSNGEFEWPQEEIDRYVDAGKHLYRIDVIGNNPHGASILDVERFDATPETAGVWVPQRNTIDGDATVYVSLDSVSSVIDACEHDPLWLIVADFTGVPHIPALPALPANIKLAAVQYETFPQFDLSAVYSADWLAGKHA